MAVNITWKVSAVAITSIDHGTAGAGSTTTVQTISIEHDGDYQLSNCRLFLSAVDSGYTGDSTAALDLIELLSWGDGETAGAFGGFQVNMDAAGSFPSGKWPTVSSKYDNDYSVFCTSRGDSSANGVLLSSSMNSTPSMPADGVIPADCTTWPSFKCRVSVPSDEGVLGERQFKSKLTYVYTS